MDRQPLASDVLNSTARSATGLRAAGKPVSGPTALPAREAGADGSPAAVSPAAGIQAADRTRHVELIWRDPVTGETLRLDFVGSPALLAGLREQGFAMSSSEPWSGPTSGSPRPETSAGDSTEDPDGSSPRAA